MRLIITKPEHDVTTKYISAWAKEVADFAESKGFDVICLDREKANKDDFNGRISKLHPDAVFLNGHGNSDCVCGHNDEILVKAEESHNLLQGGKTTYALSCGSGKILGVKVVADGDSTYIGYNDDFAFVINHKYISRPLEDPIARPFMESSNQVMFSLLKGNTAKEASDKSKNRFYEHIKRLSSSLADPESLQAAQMLYWDMKHQVCLGKDDSVST